MRIFNHNIHAVGDMRLPLMARVNEDAMKVLACLVLAVTAWLPHPAFAQQEPPVLHMACHAQLSRIGLSVEHATVNMPSEGTRRETIAVNELVEYGAPDERGRVYRTGQHTITRTCGRLTVRISGGYYNARVGGEMGAANDYAIIEVLEGTRHIAGPIAMGSCFAGSARSSYMVPCPGDWAVTVTVFRSGDDFVASLDHAYSEFRRP